MMRLLLQWVLSALSLMMVAKLLPGFHIKDFGSALGVAAVYGIFHVVLYPVLLFVAFIPVLLSFGLFIFVINALLLLLTSALLDNFQIDNILHSPGRRSVADDSERYLALAFVLRPPEA